MCTDKRKEAKAISDLWTRLSSLKDQEKVEDDPMDDEEDDTIDAIEKLRSGLFSSEMHNSETETGFKPVSLLIEPWCIPPWEHLQDAITELKSDDPYYTEWLEFLKHRQDDLAKYSSLQYAIKKIPKLMLMTSGTIIRAEEVLPIWLIKEVIDKYADGCVRDQNDIQMGLIDCINLLEKLVLKQMIIFK